MKNLPALIAALASTLAIADSGPHSAARHPQSHACLFGSNVASVLENHNPGFTAALLDNVNRANARQLDSVGPGALKDAIETLKFVLTDGDPKNYDLQSLLEEKTNAAEGVAIYQIIHAFKNARFFAFRIFYPLTQANSGSDLADWGRKFATELPLESWYLRIDVPYTGLYSLATSSQPLATAVGDKSLNPEAKAYDVSSCWINTDLERTWTSPARD